MKNLNEIIEEIRTSGASSTTKNVRGEKAGGKTQICADFQSRRDGSIGEEK